MLSTLARKAASPPSTLLRRRLRLAGYEDKKKRWLARNLGESICQIESESLEPCADPVTSAAGFDLLCSYSWKARPITRPKMEPGESSSGPQIYVPGEAPVVVPRKLPFVPPRTSLKRKVRTYRDANIARMPLYPFEPMFQSMAALNPGFKFDDVDLIINRNSLNLLFQFVETAARKDFRLDLAVVHKTLIVTPAWQRVSDALVEMKNHGRDFEQLFTKCRLEDGGTHHRAIRYELGPLNCAVLSELDAGLARSGKALASRHEQWEYHPGPISVPPSELSDAGQPDTQREKFLFETRDWKTSGKPQLCHQPHSEVIRGGAGTLSKDAAELFATARSGLGQKKMTQLWLGRVPFLVRGSVTGRSFTRVNVVHAATYFAAYENKCQVRLQKLVSLLRTLRNIADNAPDQRCIAILDKKLKPRQLRVFSHHRASPLPLPLDIRKHFWAGKDS